METLFERQLRKVFDFVVGASRGGPMRLRILEALKRRPLNTNELTKILKVDYKTTEYHLRVLKQNSIVVESESGYASKFSVSPFFKSWEKVHKQGRNNKK